MRHHSYYSIMRCAIIGLASFDRSLEAQISSSSFTTQVPVANAGHSYIEELSETVNPANGSVSVRIGVPNPKERSLNYPLYAFSYDSSTQFQMSYEPQYANSARCSPAGTPDAAISPCVTHVMGPYREATQEQGSGSGYQLHGPNTFAFSQSSVTYSPNSGQPITCTYYQKYLYEDFGGRVHQLHGIVTDSSGYNQNNSCSNNYIQILPQPLAGDEEYKIAIGNPYTGVPSTSVVNLHGDTALTVVDGHGFYDQNLGAADVEDSNGNKRSSTLRRGTYVGFDPDHPAVFPSLTFPGFSQPFRYTTARITSSYQPYRYDFTEYGDYAQSPKAEHTLCNQSQPAQTDAPYSSSLDVVTRMYLPDGRFYEFEYDPLYALLTKIKYPNGAWARYTWSAVPMASGLSTQYPTPGTVTLLGGTAFPAPNSGWHNYYCSHRHDYPAITKREVSYDGTHVAQEQSFAYSTTWDSGATGISWTSKTTTVTTKDLIRSNQPSFDTVYTYSPLPYEMSVGSSSSYSASPIESTIVYKDYNGQTLRSEIKKWGPSYVQLIADCTITHSGLVSGTFYSYQPYFWAGGGRTINGSGEPWNLTNLRSDIAEYDFGSVNSSCDRPSSTPLRETQVQYASFPNTTRWSNFTLPSDPGYIYSPKAISDRPLAVRVYGNGQLQSETDYGYDELAVQAVASPIGHDESAYDANSTNPRGNATSITKRCFIGITLCNDLVTRVVYDATGQPVSVIQNGVTTTFAYSDDYVGDDSNTAGGNTNTYLTKIIPPAVNGVDHSTSYQYGFRTGNLRVSTDQNGKQTTYSYNDPWNRLTETRFADGGLITKTFYDDGPTPSIVATQVINGSATKTSTSVMDAIGNVVQTQATSDPQGIGYVDLVTDGMGKTYTMSNPYRAKAESTYGLTETIYDALGRSAITKHPDATATQNCYDGLSSVGQTNCDANRSSRVMTTWIDSSDENGVHYQRAYDAFSRLAAVMEPNPTTGVPALETDYEYNGLNNLVSVSQKGAASESPRNRGFTYDSLSRLLFASNPEAGPVCYGTVPSGQPLTPGSCTSGYDAAGNLRSKTDARGIVTHYDYDDLNRIISKTYSNDASLTPSTCFQYDVSDRASGDSPNLHGQITHEWTQKGPCSSSLPASGVLTRKSIQAYDPLGRVLKSQQCVLTNCVAGQPFSLTQNYDLAGNLTQWTDGLDRISFTQQFDAVNRLLWLKSSWADATHPEQILSGPTYTAFGVPTGFLLGGTIHVSHDYDLRLRTQNGKVTR